MPRALLAGPTAAPIDGAEPAGYSCQHVAGNTTLHVIVTVPSATPRVYFERFRPNNYLDAIQDLTRPFQACAE